MFAFVNHQELFIERFFKLPNHTVELSSIHTKFANTNQEFIKSIQNNCASKIHWKFDSSELQ